jgi:hypothetical protein
MHNKKIQDLISMMLFIAMIIFSGIGIKSVVTELMYQPNFESVVIQLENSLPKTNKQPASEPSESGEFISGQLTATLGELCVFQLNDPNTRADWVIVPETKYYIDSSGSSLAFASNVPAQYTIIAAIIEEDDLEKQPKILTHVCYYGISPEPSPSPNPKPEPKPKPEPITLSEWVHENVPESGYFQAAALASCYESVVTGIESGAIKSPVAAYSLLRTVTQAKIDIAIWQPFLDKLSIKITERLNGSIDLQEHKNIFSEIVTRLKTIPNDTVEPEVSTVTGIE